MKKNIIIICVVFTTFSLTAFGVINWNNSGTDPVETSINEEIASVSPAKEKIKKRIFTDFIYDVGPRFRPIKKEELHNAKSFSDFIADEHSERIVSYKSLSVTILKDSELFDVKVTTNSGILSAEQINILRTVNYSTNILIEADYTEKSFLTGDLEDSTWTPYLTIVPEKQATYNYGKDALIEYLKINIKDSLDNVDPEKLQPAKMFFTVTKEGNIENVKLDRPSGYPEVDKKMIEIISSVDGAWEPAQNTKGEKVDQELVISFGLMGC